MADIRLFVYVYFFFWPIILSVALVISGMEWDACAESAQGIRYRQTCISLDSNELALCALYLLFFESLWW